jgi:hypothetical protein
MADHAPTLGTRLAAYYDLPDRSAALGEVRRILRPGGQLGIAMWGSLRPAPALQVSNAELDALGAPPPPVVVDEATLVDAGAD